MIPAVSLDAAGRTYATLDFDPDYTPPMPSGAIRGDVRKQEFCRMCHVPKYFYVDVPRRCIQCGADFVFAAAEQKRWYETYKFHFDSIATRCLACRRKRRTATALGRALEEATLGAKARPDDATALLALAEAIVRVHQQTGAGSLTKAIAASRKARRQLRGHAGSEAGPTLFWEGMAQALAGRADLAHARLAEFVERGVVGRRHAALAKEAGAWLEANPEKGP